MTTEIVEEHGGVAVEDLKVKNLSASFRGTVVKPGSHVVIDKYRILLS